MLIVSKNSTDKKHYLKKSYIFAVTVPVMHTVRSAFGSFFFIPMPNKPAYSLSEQITLLKSRGMLFKNETEGSSHHGSKTRSCGSCQCSKLFKEY